MQKDEKKKTYQKTFERKSNLHNDEDNRMKLNISKHFSQINEMKTYSVI